MSVTDVAMPIRAVVNLTLLTSKRGALATDARGCSLWRSLLERPPPAPDPGFETRSDELWQCGPGGVTKAWCKYKTSLP